MVDSGAAHGDMEKAAELLQKGTVGACALYLALRPLSPGLDVAEPENIFLGGLSFLALLLCALSLLARRILPLPEGRFWLPAGLFALCAALAVRTAGAAGYLQPALDLGNLWLYDLCTLAAVGLSARARPVRRLYLCCILAGAAAACLYAIYQKYYALDYFRNIVLSESGDQLGEGFLIRLSSTRVSGPFSYANALAGICLLCLPLFWRAALDGGRRIGAYPLGLLAVLLALAYSGSKAGLLSGMLLTLCGAVMLLPQGQRGPGRILALAGWMGLFFALMLGAGRGAEGLLGESIGQGLFALLWWWLLLRLPALAPRLPLRTGLIILALALLGLVAGTVLVTRAPEGGRLARIRQEAGKHLGVRGYYWLAGLQMAAEHPLTGVGLDNFGERYAQYKHERGWEVRRAHNHYIQLAADGGLPLLLSFLLLMGALFLPRAAAHAATDANDPSTPPPSRRIKGGNPPAVPVGKVEIGSNADAGADGDSGAFLFPAANDNFCRKAGYAAGALAFLITYYFCLNGVFTGLGLEFIFSELAGAPGSVRAKTGSSGALLVHLLTHLLLLPGAWFIIFRAGWKNLRQDTENFAPWLGLGLAIVLFHSFFDFNLYHAAVAGAFWAAAGIFRACRSCRAAAAATPQVLGLRYIYSRLLLLAVLVGGLLYFNFYLKTRLEGSVKANSGQKAQMGAATPQEFAAARDDIAAALLSRPGDAQLLLLLAQLSESALMPDQRQARRAEIMSIYQQATRLSPYSSALAADCARARLRLFPLDPQTPARAGELMRRASELYPRKPQYRYQLATLLAQQNKNTEAAHEAREALRMHESSTDDRAKLTPEDILQLRLIIQQLGAQQYIEHSAINGQ